MYFVNVLNTCNIFIQSHEIVDVKLFENNEYIIQFDENDDLLRIIQSNFTYDSKNSKCIFRYENITNQVIDRFFQTKPLINVKVSSFILFRCSDVRWPENWG